MSDAELTRLCAEKVMLWEYRLYLTNTKSDFIGSVRGWGSGGRLIASTFSPLTNDADACAVLDKMAADGWECNLFSPCPERPTEWVCAMGHYPDPRPAVGRNEDRRRTIVIAALKAKGVEIE